MKRALIYQLFAVRLLAATFYVSSVGNDSNNGSEVSPWLTLQKAVNTVACGDTIMVVANGSYVAGDARLPRFTNCPDTTTIQSSRLSEFQPAGYRTNPSNDSALYGKLKLTSGPVITTPSVWTANQYYLQAPISLDVSMSTFTVMNGNGLTLAGLRNGSQVQLNVVSAASNYGSQTFPTIGPPGGFALAVHYYVVNCSTSPACGAVNSTFQLAATDGGPPLTAGSCEAYCANTVLVNPSGSCTLGQIAYNPGTLQISDCRNASTWSAGSFAFLNIAVVGAAVDVAANTITLAVNWGEGHLSEGMPVTFSAVDIQTVGTLPSPLQIDQIYYIVNLTGSTFQVSETASGPPVILTTVGVGATSMSSADLAHDWAFRGLEIAPDGASSPFILLQFGSGNETSVYSMPHDFEVDRCFLHDNPPAQGIVRAIQDQTRNIHIHDSWIIGANLGEAQAVGGWSSPGPTVITNNFLEASTEVVLYGGASPSWAGANAAKLFAGNYWFKPPAWRYQQSAGGATGSCLYDGTTDPTHAGGEWYYDTAGMQVYRCTSSGVWAATGSPLPSGIQSIALKNMLEHKGGSYFTSIGNIFNGSYAQAQSGEIFNLSQENDSGPAATTDHNTQMYNVAINSLQWETRTSQCGATANLDCPLSPCCDISSHNLMIVNPLSCGLSFTAACPYTGRQSSWTMNSVSGIMHSDIWDHNTFWVSDSSGINGLAPMSLSPSVDGNCTFPPILNLVHYRNNIIFGDFLGDCYGQGSAVAKYMTNSTFNRNVLFRGSSTGYASVGAGNSWANTAYPTTNSSIGYMNATGGFGGAADYRLASTSPYSASNPSATLLSDDGTDIGADIDLINMATSGAAAGTPAWDQRAGLRVDAGSSQAVFRYSAPTADACAATIYRAPARIAANQVAAIADNSADSISDALARELHISGLQASTQYWYKLACGGGVLMVGNFLTRAGGQGSIAFSFDWSTPTEMRYSSSPSMSNPVSLPSAVRQFIPVDANSAVYAQTGSTGPITILIAP